VQRHRVLYVPPPSHTGKVFRPATYARMLQRFDVVASTSEQRWSSEELAERIHGCEALVTGWGSPSITADVMERAEQLSLIAHSAGSIKSLVRREIADQYLIPRGIPLFSANHAIAYNVAESTIGYMIMVSHFFLEHALHVRQTTAWASPEIPKTGQFLRGSRVGLVSASTVGREVLHLLQPFDVTIRVYDPHLSDWDAGRLGVQRAELRDIFAESDFVSVHAPSIPQTRRMIGAEQLALLRDGAVFLNTSRGSVLDHDALTREAATGRIRVVLDVTDPEPLPGDHPLRRMPNVFITPHVSGAGAYGYLKIGDMTLEALEAHFDERPVRGAVNFERYELLA
jgi:phosphoglycerate dehydrogenase-like enzyme